MPQTRKKNWHILLNVEEITGIDGKVVHDSSVLKQDRDFSIKCLCTVTCSHRGLGPNITWEKLELLLSYSDWGHTQQRGGVRWSSEEKSVYISLL